MADESQKLCGGRCCDGFYMSHAPAEIGDRYLWAVARIQAGEANFWDWEFVTIAEMLIRIDEDDEATPRYRCANLLPSGLCGVYPTRPHMCKDYPGYGNGGSCATCGFRQPLPVARRIAAGLPVLP